MNVQLPWVQEDQDVVDHAGGPAAAYSSESSDPDFLQPGHHPGEPDDPHHRRIRILPADPGRDAATEDAHPKESHTPRDLPIRRLADLEIALERLVAPRDL